MGIALEMVKQASPAGASPVTSPLGCSMSHVGNLNLTWVSNCMHKLPGESLLPALQCFYGMGLGGGGGGGGYRVEGSAPDSSASSMATAGHSTRTAVSPISTDSMLAIKNVKARKFLFNYIAVN